MQRLRVEPDRITSSASTTDGRFTESATRGCSGTARECATNRYHRTMRRWVGFCGVMVVGFGLLLAGCRPSVAPAKAEQKSYHLRGKIVAVGTGTVTVNAGAIPGLMEAMTMDYRLVDPTVASE